MEILKYVIQSIAIALVIGIVGKKEFSFANMATITFIISVSLIVLDLFAPGVSGFARQGIGFGTGFKLLETMDDPVSVNYYQQDMIPDPVMPYESGHERVHQIVGDVQLDASEQIKPFEPNDVLQYQVSTPATLNIMDRYMEGIKTMGSQPLTKQYYQAKKNDKLNMLPQAHKWKSQSHKRQLHETFVNNITSQQHTIEPFSDDKTPAELGLVYGYVHMKPSGHHDDPVDNVLYSDSLVKITTNGKEITLPPGTNFVKAMPHGGTNRLLKLRFQSVQRHSDHKLVPLMYGEPVYIVYNDQEGNSHHLSNTGTKSRADVFQILDPLNIDSSNTIYLDHPVYLRQLGDSTEYWSIKSNGSISATSDQLDATQFTILTGKGCGPLWRFNGATSESASGKYPEHEEQYPEHEYVHPEHALPSPEEHHLLNEVEHETAHPTSEPEVSHLMKYYKCVYAKANGKPTAEFLASADHVDKQFCQSEGGVYTSGNNAGYYGVEDTSCSCIKIDPMASQFVSGAEKYLPSESESGPYEKIYQQLMAIRKIMMAMDESSSSNCQKYVGQLSTGFDALSAMQKGIDMTTLQAYLSSKDYHPMMATDPFMMMRITKKCPSFQKIPYMNKPGSLI